MSNAARNPSPGFGTSLQVASDYDEAALDRLADRLADRVAERLGRVMPAQAEPLVDATEVARMHGKTRSWV